MICPFAEVIPPRGHHGENEPWKATNSRMSKARKNGWSLHILGFFFFEEYFSFSMILCVFLFLGGSKQKFA